MLFVIAALAAIKVPMKPRVGLLVIATIGFAPLSSAQTRNQACTQTRSAIAYAVRTATGKPYSATQTVQVVRTLADGTHITDKPTVTKMWRDSQGRLRHENPVCGDSFDDPDPAIQVNIFDFAGGYMYLLDQNNHIAHRIALQPMPAPAQVPKAATQDQENEATNTQLALGTQVMEGLVVDGLRVTRTIPANSIGNDKPIVIVDEVWRSQDIGMAVLSKTDDPRTGEVTIKLSNISRAEPDPALFQPPPGYTVVDETTNFKIVFRTGQ